MPELSPLTPQQLLDLLKERGIIATTLEHEPMFTVEESRSLRGALEGGHTKNLFLKDKKSNYFLLVLEETAQIDLKTVHTLIGGKGRVSFGNADRLMEYLGVKPGSVSAFCVVNDHDKAVKLIIDAPLLEHEMINCHPLTNCMTTTISREDLLEFANACGHEAEILQISQ